MQQQGLYDPRFEHDACGVGFIVDMKGRKSHRIVRQALDSINSFLPMLLYPRKYQTSNAERLWGGTLPWPDWRQTLVRVMKSCGFCPSDTCAQKPARSAA